MICIYTYHMLIVCDCVCYLIQTCLSNKRTSVVLFVVACGVCEKLGTPQCVLPGILQCCVSYSLTTRLAPCWNKAGPYLISGTHTKHGRSDHVCLSVFRTVCIHMSRHHYNAMGCFIGPLFNTRFVASDVLN